MAKEIFPRPSVEFPPMTTPTSDAPDALANSSGTRFLRPWRRFREQLPQLGLAGSRSAQLHSESEGDNAPESAVQLQPLNRALSMRLYVAVFLGALGTMLITVGGLGAGAFPVVHNPYWDFPGVNTLARMLHSTTVMVFVGIGFLVYGWLLLLRFAVSTPGRPNHPIPVRTYWRTFFVWVTPLMFTPPLFTQDIYSYLAQGAIAAKGWDPYGGGPVDLLGIDDPLARSVPLMWAHSPAPYGPVALGYGEVISMLTGNSIILGIVLHRLVAILGLALSGWALVRLARRCGVSSGAALWLGVLNPLAILHLIGGIHNEAALIGLLLAGMELVLRGVDKEDRPLTSRWILIIGGFVLITMAGMVKVTALIGLGFAGAALARWFGGRLVDLCTAAAVAVAVSATAAVVMSLLTGVGFGWITSQGGAAEIISWMSITTSLGLASGALGGVLGLGDHIDSSLVVFRTLGLLVGGFWVVRMLWASFRGRIHAVGGLGVATLILVLFFPVVHPWYLLWAILPLAAWANRRAFHLTAIIYSVVFSFFILPRGLSLPTSTVIYIYLMSLVFFLVVVSIMKWLAGGNADLAEAMSIRDGTSDEQWRRYVIHRQRTRLSLHDNRT